MKKIYKVLIIDDDISVARIVKHTLERYNFWVQHAENGRFGINELKVKKFDLVICDILMPVMDGQTFLREAASYLTDTKVVMLTGVGDRSNVIQAASNNAKMYLLKPISPSTLFPKVKEALLIEEKNIFDRKNHPITIEFEEEEGDLLAVVQGVPGEFFLSEFSEALFQYSNNLSNYQWLHIDLAEEFYYYENSVELLDRLVDDLKTNHHLKPKMSFRGAFFGHFERKDITGFSHLVSSRVNFFPPANKSK